MPWRPGVRRSRRRARRIPPRPWPPRQAPCRSTATVPDGDEARTDDEERQRRRSGGSRGRPGKSTRSRSANEPKAANRLTWGLEKRRWVRPKTSGTRTAARTDRLSARSSGSLARNHAVTPDQPTDVRDAVATVASAVGPGRSWSSEQAAETRAWSHRSYSVGRRPVPLYGHLYLSPPLAPPEPEAGGTRRDHPAPERMTCPGGGLDVLLLCLLGGGGMPRPADDPATAPRSPHPGRSVVTTGPGPAARYDCAFNVTPTPSPAPYATASASAGRATSKAS